MKRFSDKKHENKGNLTPNRPPTPEGEMDSIIYLVGLVVVVMAILSFLGLH